VDNGTVRQCSYFDVAKIKKGSDYGELQTVNDILTNSESYLSQAVEMIEARTCHVGDALLEGEFGF
jgi:hypothetical protein